jgi:tetratricopeptide (TPR) repeat protein
VFEGACAPYGETNVWSPLATGLLAHLGIPRDATPEDTAAAIRAGTASWFDDAPGPLRHGVEALVHLAGLPSDLDAVDPTAARTAVFAAVVAGIRAGTQKGPVVVRIDDLQWSHAALRDLLAVLARSLAGCPFLLVTTARPDESVEWPPEVDRAVMLTIPIGPLGRRESALLVEALAAGRLDEGLVDRLHERSGGNPLFLVELASLAVEGVEPGADVELPGTLRALIAARLDQLPPERRAIVDNAAIIGSEGPLGSLREFADALGQPFEEAWLDDLAAVGMLDVEDGWWRFRSDVVREVAYQTLTKQARALRHAGVASVLAGYDRPPIERMAHHAASAAELLADLGSVPGVPPMIRDQAVELLERAAARSFDVGGFRRGTDLSERALALVDPEDTDARMRLLLLRATGLVELRSPAPARLVLDELLALAERAGDRAVEGQTHRLLGSVEQLDGDLVAARTELGAAVAIFRELDDPAQLALALRVRGFAEVFGGSLQDAEWYLGEADDVYAGLGDVRGRAWIEHSRGWVRFLSGDNVGAAGHLHDAIAAFDAIGDHAGSTWSNGILAFLAFYEGRFEDAEALAGEVSREARQWGDEWGASMMLTLLSAIRLWSGRFAESIELGERALVGFRRIGDRFGAVQALAPVSRARAALGRTTDADRGMEELLTVADAFGEMSFPTMAAAGVAMHLGRGARAVELAQEAVDRMASNGGGVPEAKVQLAAGLVLAGRAEEALVVLDDLDATTFSFARAVRALARAVTGDDRGAAEDADAVLGGEARSYFDRSLAAIVAAAVAARAGGPGASESISRALIVTRAGGDVHLMAVAAELARRHGIVGGSGEAQPTDGWATVTDALTRPALGGVA